MSLCLYVISLHGAANTIKGYKQQYTAQLSKSKSAIKMTELFKKSLPLNTTAPKLGLKMNCQHQIRYQAECGYIFLVPLIPRALLRTVAGCAACEAPEPTGINPLSGLNNDSVELYIISRTRHVGAE